MKVILSGGGTGGHIYPALAIAGELRKRLPSIDILYIGTEKGLESQLVPQAGLAFKTIDITGIDRSSFLKAGKSLIKFPFSFFQARDIIKEYQPDLIVGTGGYVSFPTVLAGTYMNIRTVIHEQNAMPGLANRNLASRVDCVMLTFEEARAHLEAKKIVLTGLPVRQEIKDVQRFPSSGSGEATFTLLAFGGSLGAASINRAMADLIDRYRNTDINIIWITGQGNFDEVSEKLASQVDLKSLRCHLEMVPYMYKIEEAMAKADLALCRAGASTVCELEVLGIPAIFVPYPYAADNHQEKNAKALVDKKAAFMIIDEFLDGDNLFKKVEELRKDRQRLAAMGQNMMKEARPDALNRIVDEIFNLVG